MASASLRTRLISALLFVGLIPAGLLSWAALAGASFAAGQQERALKAASVATLDKIDRNLFERYGDVQAFAAHPTLLNREHWYQPGAERNPIVAAANRYVALYGCYPLTLVVDLNGKVIAVNDRDAQGRPVSTSAFYERSYGGATWLEAAARNQFLNGPQGLTGTAVSPAQGFDPRELGGRGQKAVTFASPVRDETGKTIAVWVNYADLNLVDEILASAYADLKAQGLDTARLQLTDRAGQSVASAGVAANGARLSAQSWSHGALGYPGLGWKLAISVEASQALAFVTSLQWRVARANLFALFCTVGFAWWLAGSISRPLNAAVAHLQASSRDLQTSSTQVAGVADALAGSATSQAASIEETSAAMHQITSLIRRHAEHSRQASQRTGSSQAAVEEAKRSLGALELSMVDMKDASQQISRIISSIESIAYQTNILALNAAVEAARAGDAGLGFAVVAGEVKRLAQTAANASQETGPLVERAVQTAMASHDRLRLVGGSFDRLHQDVLGLLSVVDEVSRGTAEQSRGVAEIETALLRIQKEAEGTAASAGRSSEASGKLLDCASDTQGVVSTLETLLTGSAKPGC